jgi:hypothetical protein
MKLGDILSSINIGKTPMITTANEKEYVPFIVSRCFANFPDTLFHANELNAGMVTDRKMHYDYLFHAVRKRKRFSPWLKSPPEAPERQAVAWFYGVSGKKADEYLRILKPTEVAKILEEYGKAPPS